MAITKDDLRAQFRAKWQEHYDLPVLKEFGFHRTICQKCGRSFWTVDDEDVCGDSGCVGYKFIGNPTGNKTGYVESWKKIEKYFTDNGHKSVYSYPTVARWRDDLYFTIASIADFQPYVVAGEVDPPGNPLIIPQACVRFVSLKKMNS